jgi:hypothetical protein
MTTAQIVPNPFALMMDPESVLAAVAKSERLARLSSQICRPLDKPVAPRPDTDRATVAFDQLLDAAAECTNTAG